MPSWPIEMPSDTEMVPNSSGNPPAARTPSLARLASRSSERLQGVISFQDDATPIWGLAKSSSSMPTARSMARAGALASPSVTSKLRGLTLTVSLPVERSSTVVTIRDGRRGTDRVTGPGGTMAFRECSRPAPDEPDGAAAGHLSDRVHAAAGHRVGLDAAAPARPPRDRGAGGARGGR